LVDAYGIDPEHSWFLAVAKSQQGTVQIPSDGELVSVELNPCRLIWVTPSV
jgi:hypothetical protein